MVFYFGLLIFFLVSAMGRNRTERFFVKLDLIVLFFLLGFRALNIGNDTPNYIYFFERLKNLGGFVDPQSRFEVGYQIYSGIIGHIFHSSQALLIVSALISALVIGILVKHYSEMPAYSLFLFIGLRFMYFYMSGLRQSLAIDICILAFIALKEKKTILYFLLTLLACTFHISAIVFFAIYPITKMRISSKGVIITIAVILSSYLFLNQILSFVLGHLSAYYSHYTSTSAFDANNLANYISLAIKICFICLALLCNYWRKQEGEDESITDTDTFMYMLIISAGMSLISTRVSLLDRMESYYWIFSIIYIPNMIKKLRNPNRAFVIMGVSVFVIVYNLSLLSLRPEWTLIIPYKFFWQ